MLESEYKKHLLRVLMKLFPGCVVLKNDSGFMQGMPDFLILHKDRWAMLEVKASATAEEQPNQRYYIERFQEMSFGAFIYPENEEEVLDALQQSFAPRRQACVSRR
jgi:hypothetical protein